MNSAQQCVQPLAETADVVVIGAGIAGAGCAYEVVARRSVVLLERESQPGYHTTARSAALYSRTYGNAPMRALTRASQVLLTTPPVDFTATPLLAPRGALLVARAEQLERLEALFVELQAHEPGLKWLSFVADKTLVAGFDPDRPGFFWLAGQGGYGIQTAPAAARLAAALIVGEPVPPELAAEGATATDFAPQRLRGVRSRKDAS